jgi:UDP-N-acetylmuramyl pentapeptide phosphotransferase/UDP-N-acetylglucosamine-1-phosphate transferase
MDSNSFIFFFVLIFFGFFFNKYFDLILNKYKPGLLVDSQFKKPQAFHDFPAYTFGGVGIFFSFLIVCLYMFLSKQVIYYEYLSFCILFFILGLVDDLKITIRPKFRLFIMIFFLIILVLSNEFYIKKTGITFLNDLLEIDIFALFFICLCFLFIINGSNLIDGFNGLLSIHSLIILINLSLINYFSGNYDLAYMLFCGTLIILVFLKYNFPSAKIFLGDSGSYFLGAFLSISVIATSIANPLISPFYFCILLFYLFFEVFFSFIRKIVVEKKSPLFPDDKHLHMLLYQILYAKNKNKLKSNYYVSVIINLIYLILTIPAILNMDSGLFCKYYSLIFFIIYLFSYKLGKEKVKDIIAKG